MLISEMIKQMQELQAKHGDIPVKVRDGGDFYCDYDPEVDVVDEWDNRSQENVLTQVKERVLLIY